MRMIALLLIGLTFGGCGAKVFMPYESRVSCKKGAEEGMCGSIPQVYHETRRLDGRE